jgi:RNA polymerase sigma-70 factor (ECF subfamily)
MIEDEAAFYRLLKEEDPTGLEKMVATYANRLLRGAFFLCRNEPEAQDLVQDTFYQAFRSIKNFNGDSSLYFWLYRILRNIYFNQTRRKRKFVSLLASRRVSWINPDVAGRDTAAQIGIELTEAISRLPLKHREILLLRYMDGYKFHEIGEILDVSLGTVKSRLYYALRKFKKNVLRTPGLGRLPEKENSNEM